MKKTFLALIALAAVALMLCGFVGMPSRTLSDVSPETAAENETEPAEENETDSDDAVYSALSVTRITSSGTYEFYIPAFSCDSDDAVRLNREMYLAVYDNVDRALEDLKETNSFCRSIKYETYRNGDVVSVLVCMTLDYPCPEYWVMNLNTATGKEVDRAALLAAKGLTEESFVEMAAEAAEAAFDDVWPSYFNGSSFRAQQLAETLAEGRFGEDLPLFLNASGELCMITPIYQSAGASYAYRVVVVAP